MHGYWKTLTFIAALRHDQISVRRVGDGSMNGDIFGIEINVACA
jgi:hypothetical protein